MSDEQSIEDRRAELQRADEEAAKRREEASKRTFTVTSPDKGYSDEFAGVTFVDGVGVAAGDNYAALNYFLNHPSFTVEPGGELPKVEDETDLQRTQRLQFIDRTTARDAVVEAAKAEEAHDEGEGEEKPKPAARRTSAKADSK
jgi:hypothetical protein